MLNSNSLEHQKRDVFWEVDVAKKLHGKLSVLISHINNRCVNTFDVYSLPDVPANPSTSSEQGRSVSGVSNLKLFGCDVFSRAIVHQRDVQLFPKPCGNNVAHVSL